MTDTHRLAGHVAFVALEACATGSSPKENAPRPNQPSAETQQVTFQLISILECFGGERPAPGRIVLVGIFSAPGDPIEVFDGEHPWKRGSDFVRDQRRRTAAKPEGATIALRPLPDGVSWGPEDIRIDFPKTSPPRRSSQARAV